MNTEDTASCLRRVQRDGKTARRHNVTDVKGEGILKKTCYGAGIVPDTVGIHPKSKSLCFE